MTLKRPPGAVEVKFVSCSVVAPSATEVIEVELESSGIEIPLLWERISGNRTHTTFNQVLSAHLGANTALGFFVSATGPFNARCVASGE